MTTLEQARHNLAQRYAPLIDTHGRVHRSICADAIMRGDWDSGSIVRDEVARLRAAV